MNTLTDLFATFPLHGDDPAMVFRTGVRRFVLTYSDIHTLALRMNGWLAAQGIGEGDRVLLWCPNSPWWGVAFWGIVARGAVAVPVDFMSGGDRAETIASLTDARLVIQSREKPERLAGRPTVLLEELRHLLAQTEPLTAVHSAGPDDIAELLYTSGTTGAPKGVILTHRNLIANLLQVNRHITVVSEEFTFLSLLPLSHMFEQMGGFFTPLYRGATIAYIRTLKPSAILEALEEEDIYAMIAVPRLLQLLKGSIEQELEHKGLRSIFERLLKVGEKIPRKARKLLFHPIHKKFGANFTLFVSGGAPLDPQVFRFWDGMGFTVLEGYGLTECSPVLAANDMGQQAPGSVGRPLPGVELRIEGGEILARGENVFSGYYRNEEATRATFSDGWFRTGDLGEFDSDGRLRIKGRSKELIVTGAGVNVYPDEIEALLNALPGVKESCVVGLDRGGGEEVHAVLILDGERAGPEEIVAEVNARLDDLHRITGFTVWPEAEFPKTTTMKIRKFVVKKQLEEHAAAGEGALRTTDRLIALIARITDTPVDKVKEESVLVTELGLTSIGRLELVNAIEQEFRLDLEDAAIDPQTRVTDLREKIRKREKTGTEEHFRRWGAGRSALLIRRFLDRVLHYPLFRTVVRLEASGTEHLREEEMPVIFISNHLSYLDHPTIMFALPPKWRYNTSTAAWEEFFFRNFRNFSQKLWKRLAFEYATLAFTIFPLPQSRGFRGSLRHMGKLIDKGMNVLIFPEGTRSPDGTLLEFQQGLGVIVREMEVPVVPVSISGLEKVLPRGASRPRSGNVHVRFGPPIRFSTESAAEIVEKARLAVRELQ
ncbi:AMP-binding protein [Geobacter sp. DSM 9736]|uniref:AMP-binding protein n=1 Tax=Geobacter sp. DSM 9736 TaxID=1277350 RepID=UPI000B502B7E|nr:AMP-binding protein [Geobacter sp. DSM 9736]SNB44722.1 long-chain acyl-CoA synthetase [Geobacter sp. DSM 9736]